MDELSILQAEVTALRADLEALRTEVRTVRGRLDLTMRGQCRCPGCGGRRLLHARQILDRAEGAREKLSLVQPGWWTTRGEGQFEAYVCIGCGLVEWYVPDVSGIEIDGKVFVLLDGESPRAGPYR